MQRRRAMQQNTAPRCRTAALALDLTPTSIRAFLTLFCSSLYRLHPRPSRRQVTHSVPAGPQLRHEQETKKQSSSKRNALCRRRFPRTCGARRRHHQHYVLELGRLDYAHQPQSALPVAADHFAKTARRGFPDRFRWRNSSRTKLRMTISPSGI